MINMLNYEVYVSPDLYQSYLDEMYKNSMEEYNMSDIKYSQEPYDNYDIRTIPSLTDMSIYQ